ncbi:hypothetical protein RhiirA1_519291 [Rhizophagus irregularis]|uniref:Uncharacterized protein n=1 Tax=Rhizophagus irregularis TaxID=588596 RepID=A0A2N1NM55_9GLOM|nr:hypothetical protein RhiirA1_519291 [Rhizophagus irregularis]PKK75025.1 hypothetical protein RhiirC2_708442 [Rhizophagus irregularis]
MIPKLSLIPFLLLLLLIEITNSQIPTGDTSATILLTPNGTKNYLKNKKTYVNDMSNEISMALSIEKSRIFISYDRYQYKKNTSEDQILLLVNIKGTKGPDQPSSFMLRRNLNNSITYKDISLGLHTRDLDSTYGAPENRSWVFLLVPIFFNIITSWYLVYYQLNSSKDAENWWKDYPIVALGFVLLSLIDLEALNVVTSRCAGSEALNAKFTGGGKKRVDRSIIIIAFIEDVPQLIIYVLYQRYTVIPATIPILVLSSACIVLLFKICYRAIVWFLYRCGLVWNQRNIKEKLAFPYEGWGMISFHTRFLVRDVFIMQGCRIFGNENTWRVSLRNVNNIFCGILFINPVRTRRKYF